MTATIKALSDGLSGELQVGGNPSLRFGADTSGQLAGFRNRIINGGMMIDQRNAGASVTPANNQYMVDRFAYVASQASKFTAQQVTTAPAGFVNSLKMTTSSAVSVGSSDYFAIIQYIEGLNCSDFGWGAVGASSVTLSFWVRSSLTGTFSGALNNSDSTRSYPFSYTISSADTWEQKAVTIVGDASGTWLKTNGIGIKCTFSLGTGTTYSGTANIWSSSNYVQSTGATSVVGTSGATFYITGVQLEPGSIATPFEHRPYGTELALCQRYYWRGVSAIQQNSFTAAYVSSGISFPVNMRVAPTINKNGTWVVSGCGQPQAGYVSVNGFIMLATSTGATNCACYSSDVTTQYFDTSGAEL